MGEAMASGTLTFNEELPGGERIRSTLTVEFWDRDDPEPGEEPCINITAEDHDFDRVATAGLGFEQVKGLRDSLASWIEEQRESRETDRRTEDA